MTALTLLLVPFAFARAMYLCENVTSGDITWDYKRHQKLLQYMGPFIKYVAFIGKGDLLPLWEGGECITGAVQAKVAIFSAELCT